jgi:hypothetical protein
VHAKKRLEVVVIVDCHSVFLTPFDESAEILFYPRPEQLKIGNRDNIGVGWKRPPPGGKKRPQIIDRAAAI